VQVEPKTANLNIVMWQTFNIQHTVYTKVITRHKTFAHKVIQVIAYARHARRPF